MIEPSIDLSSLKDFVRSQVIPGASERDRNYSHPTELYQALYQLGWWTSFIPSDLGGSGISTVDLCHVLKTLAFGSAGMATSFSANLAATVSLFSLTDKKLKTQIFKDITSRFCFSSFCFTEADSGSDLLSIKTCAEPTPQGFVLTGSKCFITNASYAKHFIVVAKVKGAEDPKKSLSVFYVPAQTPGVSTGSPLKKVGQRDSNTTEVFFDRVSIPHSHQIGKTGDALKITGNALQRSRTLLSASAVGLCERASQLAKDHLSQRILYSRPLLEQPVIRCFLAQKHAELAAGWYLTLAAAQAWDQGVQRIELSSMAKLFTGQTAVSFSQGAMELFGGWGYSEEFEIERLYRDAKLFETLEGPTFVQQSMIAKELFPKTEKSPTIQTKKRAA